METIQPPDIWVEAPSVPDIPHNRAAEEAVLGSVLINPNTLYELLFLKPEHFYIERNRWIWQALLWLEERRTPLDLVTVADELERQGQLNEIGGPAYITSLINQVPSSLNASAYGRIVEGYAVRRKMINAANTIATLAYDEKIDVGDCLTKSSEQLINIQTAGQVHELISMGDLLSHTYDAIVERSKDPKEVWGFSTGLPTFDKKTGGIQVDELLYLVGSPGVGKTWLDLTWGMELGRQAPGAIFSLEMKRLAIGRRVLSGLSGVPSRAMKSGYVDTKDWTRIQEALGQTRDLPVWIDDSSYDTYTLRAALLHAKQEYGIRWFILDYALLLMDAGKDETEQTKIISANLKRTVNDLNLAGIVLQSVTKVNMEGEEPRMNDQRGSGQAIHDADVQLFLTRLYDKDDRLPRLSPDVKKHMATLWCSKGRELEQSKFKIHLTRRGSSPFWAEYQQEAGYE